MKKIYAILLTSSVMMFAQLPNAGFENWTSGEPDGWYTPNSSGTVVISATTPAQQGNFALKGEVATVQGFIIPPMVLLGTDGEGIPNTIRYTRLSGYYKYTQAGSDLFIARIILTKTGDITVGAGSLTLPPATNFTPFNVDITYATNDTPDTLAVSFEVNGVGVLGTVGTSYVIDNLSLSTSTSNDDQTIEINNFSLEQNYPNPFNPKTTIKFNIPNVETLRATSLRVSLKIYDLIGNEVATLADEEKSAGEYEVEFNGGNLSSGIYYYTLRAGSFVETKKLMLMK